MAPELKLKLLKQKTEAETPDVTRRQFITVCAINWGLTLLIPTRIDYSLTSKWFSLHIYCGANSDKTQKSFLASQIRPTYGGFKHCHKQIEPGCHSYYLFPRAWQGEPGFCKSGRTKKASALFAVEAATKSIKPCCRALSQSHRLFFYYDNWMLLKWYWGADSAWTCSASGKPQYTCSSQCTDSNNTTTKQIIKVQ